MMSGVPEPPQVGNPDTRLPADQTYHFGNPGIGWVTVAVHREKIASAELEKLLVLLSQWYMERTLK